MKVNSKAVRRWSHYVIEGLEKRVLLSDVKFAVFGDYSSDTQTQPEVDVSNLVKSWNPAFVVTTGDNNYPSGAATTIDANIGQYYHEFISPYLGSYGAGSADGVNHFWPTLGNHDWDTGTVKPYTDYFTLPGNERYYTVQQGNVGLFVVDSDDHEPDGNTSGSTQALWLKNALASSTAQWKFVFLHHPPYTSGVSGGTPNMAWPFKDWGATAVFAGHDHDYERLNVNGETYFVDGLGGESITGFITSASGSQVRYNGDYGSMLVDATDTGVTFKFITRKGALIDTYTINASTAPAAPSNLQAKAISSGRVDLSWTDNSTNETGFSIERSTDNVNFTQIATTGSNTTSYSDTTVAGGVTYYYRARATNGTSNSAYSNTANVTTPVTVALPAPWVDGDVGNTVLKGSATFANPTFTVKGAGNDLGGKSDAFNYVYQTLSGNGQIVARVASEQNTNSSAKAGVMIRESLSSGARDVVLALTPSNQLAFVRRTSANKNASVSLFSGIAAPTWVRLVRSGSTITAYRSADGSNWTQVGSVSISMASNVYIGLAVASGSTKALNTSTFDGVAVSTSTPSGTNGVIVSGSTFSTTPLAPLQQDDPNAALLDSDSSTT